MKRNVVIVIMVIVIVFLGIFLWGRTQEVKELREIWAKCETDLAVAKEQEQIEAFFRNAIVFYDNGNKKGAIRCLEYALILMKEKEKRDLGLLPDKMMKDPDIAKVLERLSAKKPGKTKKSNVLDLHRRGGLFQKTP